MHPFLSLPLDVHHLILLQLVPAPLPADSTSVLGAEFLQCRSALRSLCLTSRTFRDVAQPFLYRNVAITDTSQIVPLFLTLLRNRHLRDFVRHFALLVPLEIEGCSDGWDTIPAVDWTTCLNDTEKMVVTYFRGIYEDAKGAPVPVFAPAPPREIPSMRVSLVGIILALAGRLEDLLIRAPRHTNRCLSRHVIKTALGHKIGEVSQQLGQQFSCLRKLQMQSDPLSLPLRPMANVWRVFSPILVPIIEGAKARCLEYYGDDGFWGNVMDLNFSSPASQGSAMIKSMQSLDGLRLLNSWTSPRVASISLQHCKALKSFCWTFDQRHWGPPEVRLPGGHVVSRDSLDDALLHVSGTVERLHLESLTQNEPRRPGSTKAPWRFVSCLRSFENLTDLTIDTLSLFGPSHNLRMQLRNRRWVDLLPRSLERIVLIERLFAWDLLNILENELRVSEYQYWLETKCTELVYHSRKGLPSLRRFEIQVLREFDGKSSDGLNFRTAEAIEAMSSGCATQGVDFEWQWQNES